MGISRSQTHINIILLHLTRYDVQYYTTKIRKLGGNLDQDIGYTTDSTLRHQYTKNQTRYNYKIMKYSLILYFSRSFNSSLDTPLTSGFWKGTNAGMRSYIASNLCTFLLGLAPTLNQYLMRSELSITVFWPYRGEFGLYTGAGWYLPTSSMYLASRAIRESATTILYAGLLRHPIRASLILTGIWREGERGLDGCIYMVDNNLHIISQIQTHKRERKHKQDKNKSN